MNDTIVWRLVAKDLYLYRWMILVALIGGVASMLLAGQEGTAGNIGLILMMTSIIAVGVLIAMYGILTERKEKSLLFVLSLPVSPMQYTTAKIVSALIAFLIPWLVLTATMVVANVALDPPPDGDIPFVVAMMFFFLANFCILVALLLITGSEGWAIAGILTTNLSVSVFMTTVRGLPGIGEHVEGNVAVWSSTILTVIGVEAAVIVMSLGLAFYFQSRKKDFV